MPRGNATGPMGMGPMTGRKAGYCAGNNMPGYLNNAGGLNFGMGFGRGAGFGRRGGRGGGLGFRNRFVAKSLATFGGIFAAPYSDSDQGPDIEKRFLNNRVEMLQTELDAIKKRLDELTAKDQS
ncbi:MAG TPA: DUF5320 domain-containing protein [Smithellaceae bacterium]|nr:DUF5320 domain-containing protein [Smithellaceae bacterium]